MRRRFDLSPTRRMLMGALVLFCVVDIYMETILVSKFGRIFQEAFPGRELPSLTRFFLHHQAITTLMAVVFLAVRIWIIYHRGIAWLYLLFVLMGLQMATTVVALVLGLQT